MPYEPAKDVKLFEETFDFEGTRISVSVFQYNQGEKKLQIGRQNATSEGELTFAKLGRLRKNEIETILPAIQRAVQAM